jgi:glutaredoxin
MKKIMMLCMLALFAFPFVVKAEEEDKINIYLFKGDGCPHCADAEDYFNSLSEEEKDKFHLIKYEVWYNETNKKLMDQVAEKLEETVTGVPYIVVGEKTFSGFNEEIGEEIMNFVNEMYEGDSREDIVSSLAEDLGAEEMTGSTSNSNNTDSSGNQTTTSKNEKASKEDATIVTITVLGVLLVVGGLLVWARKKM